MKRFEQPYCRSKPFEMLVSSSAFRLKIECKSCVLLCAVNSKARMSAFQAEYTVSRSVRRSKCDTNSKRNLNCKFRTSVSRIWDHSPTDRICGYEPQDGGSIPSGPAICLHSTVWSVHHVANVATRVRISLKAPSCSNRN